jgi:REP element-mobilizing transposase RayT
MFLNCGRHGCHYTRFVIKKRPPRLHQIFQSYDPPLFFLRCVLSIDVELIVWTMCMRRFRKYALRGMQEFNVGVGRYVIMPDHIHFFVRGDDHFDLGKWVNGLKRSISVALGATNKLPLWQPGFFDHVLRNDESYAQKWEYVRQNPVRAGFIDSAAEWRYQVKIVTIDRA